MDIIRVCNRLGALAIDRQAIHTAYEIMKDRTVVTAIDVQDCGNADPKKPTKADCERQAALRNALLIELTAIKNEIEDLKTTLKG
jgi:hypothetical protein